MKDEKKSRHNTNSINNDDTALNISYIEISYVPTGGFLGDNAAGSIYYKIEGFKTLNLFFIPIA